MTASKAAAIIRILSKRADRDPRFVDWVTAKVEREPLFPPRCNCPSYGHGLTMTRVNATYCPVHGAKP